MEIHIPEIAEMRDQLSRQASLLQTIAEQNETKAKENELVISFSADERITKFVACRFLGVSKIKLEELTEQGLIAPPNKWNRYLVSDLIDYKNR